MEASANIFEFEGMTPVIHSTAFVHPQATVIGNVVIGANVYVGPHATLRGDFGRIVVADGCNVQESCTIHMFPGVTVTLEEGAHIGHGAIIHGAHIGANALIGMNSVIMDHAQIGSGSIVGALCFIPNDFVVPERKVVVGNPAKIVKDVSDEMLAWKTEGTKLYQQLPQRMQQSLKPCEPLRQLPENSSQQASDYKTWTETKSAQSTLKEKK